MRNKIFGSGFILISLLLSGCQTTPKLLSLSGTQSANPVSIAKKLASADALCKSADTKSSVLQGIQAYELVLKEDPRNYQALFMIGNQYILLGAAYETEKKEKEHAYKKAMEYCDLAMQTNPAFHTLRAGGTPVREAVRVLSQTELDAMTFWATAVFYYFDECLYKFGKFFHQSQLEDARLVLAHASKLDPDFGGGVLHVSWGIYYLAVPAIIGGSREKSEQAFAQAMAVGTDRMLTRWARARYYSAKYKDRDLFKLDLDWILAQKPTDVSDYGSWVIFMQRDARKLLSSL